MTIVPTALWLGVNFCPSHECDGKG